MKISKNISLKPYNTFGVEVFAEHFVEAGSVADLEAVIADKQLTNLPLLVIGGGSNMLLTQNVKGLVLKTNFLGITVTEQGNDIFVEAGGGVVWNDLVLFCVDKGFGGIENLTLIPGSVGAAPIQNIGAYGVELKDVFHSCKAFELATGKLKEFSKDQCEFGYRESVFKGKFKGNFIITAVTLRLSKAANLNTSYGAIEEELTKRGISNPSIKDVSSAVAHIRVAKLPDPSTIGNCGSFFKNPIVPNEVLAKVKANYPDVVNYPASSGHTKIAAGWLIEQCGWKGKQVGNTGTWKNQALVLVNHGGASGKEVLAFSEQIIQSVFQKFGVLLEREVNII